MSRIALLVALLVPLAPVSKASAQDAQAKIDYRENVVYGEVGGVKLLSDIALPEGKEKLAALVSVHGGRWVGGNKRDASTIQVKEWAGFGFFAMSIEYRLRGAAAAPGCYQDLQCAIRFVHAHAKEYRIDTKQIYLIGQSAGGHLVSLAATLGDGPFARTGGWEKESNDFRAVISVAAAYDLPTLPWGNLWAPKVDDVDQARVLASPVNHVKKESKPLLVLHSDNDGSVPIANALKMVAALEKEKARHKFIRYPAMGHMGINKEVIARAREFIMEMSKD